MKESGVRVPASALEIRLPAALGAADGERGQSRNCAAHAV